MVKKKKLPKWATTVTPFSKFLALSMLVIFPILGFYLGRYYEKTVAQTSQQAQSDCNIVCNPKPNKLVVSRLENKAFNLASFTTTITDDNVISQLYTGLAAFKVLPADTHMGCPMIPAGYQPVNYDLTFYKDSLVLRHIIFSPPGCRNTIKLDNNAIEIGITIESIDFEKTLQHALNLSGKEFRGYGND